MSYYKILNILFVNDQISKILGECDNRQHVVDITKGKLDSIADDEGYITLRGRCVYGHKLTVDKVYDIIKWSNNKLRKLKDRYYYINGIDIDIIKAAEYYIKTKKEDSTIYKHSSNIIKIKAWCDDRAEKEMVTKLNQKRTCINKHNIMVERDYMCDYCDRRYNSKSSSCHLCIDRKRNQDRHRDENVKSINFMRNLGKRK